MNKLSFPATVLAVVANVLLAVFLVGASDDDAYVPLAADGASGDGSDAASGDAGKSDADERSTDREDHGKHRA